MDNRGYIKKFVLNIRRNEDRVIIMRSVLRFACLGAGILTVCMLLSLIWHFYYAELVGIIAIGAAALFGLIWGIVHRGDPILTAVNLDSFGTKEKLVTAFEEIRKGEDIPEGSVRALQIEDAAVTLRQSEAFLREQHKKQQRKLLPWKELLIFLLITAAGIGSGFIPSKVREEAKEEHEAKVEAEEIIEEIEKIEEKLEEISKMDISPEEKEALKNMKESLEASRQDLKKTKDKNALKKAKDK
ncbi:MAG: hypothetical protein IJ065_15015, partial [Eubacterium sp.]|nr:hypothetical protein [Eubacterium sp.]